MVVPERQALEEWAATNNKAGDFAELCNDPKAKGYIQDELNKTGKKLGVKTILLDIARDHFYFHGSCIIIQKNNKKKLQSFHASS